jgi:endonuclease/exonuclease/phosphatase family metal-dependent hydrolase
VVLEAEVELAGRPLRIWLVHPPNPLSRLGRARGGDEINALAERIGSSDGDRLVFGDMNRTDGSPYFGDFLRKTGLRDSRLGFGRQASWPAWSPYKIAIDHAFVSTDLAVTSRRLGPAIGSDHLPLVIELAPAASFDSVKNLATHADQSSP